MKFLKFSYHNSKLNKLAKFYNMHLNQVVGFDLPAGYTCPAANLCKSYAHPVTGKIRDAKTSKFRCYAASGESRFTAVRNMHWYNHKMLFGKSFEQMYKLILKSLPKGVKIVRIHSSGDFFNEVYFRAWCKVASIRPNINFFGYTKILPYVNIVRDMNLPNFKLVYSFGGKLDSMLTCEPAVYVVERIADSDSIGVPVACINNPADDFERIMAGESFALLIHGTQPAKRKPSLSYSPA